MVFHGILFLLPGVRYLMLSKDGWVQSDIMSQNPDIAVHYQDVCKQLDQFLEKYGYVTGG